MTDKIQRRNGGAGLTGHPSSSEGYDVDIRTLRKLLALYFEAYPVKEEDMEVLASELSQAGFRLTDVVDCCERVLPLISTAECWSSQSDAMRRCIALHKKIKG